MDIVHSFLVRPKQSDSTSVLDSGASVPTSGKLADLLLEIYERVERESDVDICFSMSNGQQQNDMRDLFLAYVQAPTLANAKPIAENLRDATTGRSGTGLLFLMTGIVKGRKKLVVSRFPADSGILAEEGSSGLRVEFLERIFMKSARLYKSAVFSGSVTDGDFWKGQVVDKQISRPGQQASDYWIVDFLSSEFTITPELGTRRFAEALRKAAADSDDIEIKQQVASIANLSGGLRGKNDSIGGFLTQLGASPETQTAVKSALKKSHLYDERFSFQPDEFQKKLRFRMVELDNGAHLMAESNRFDDIFKVEDLVDDTSSMSRRYVTEGGIVNELLKPRAR